MNRPKTFNEWADYWRYEVGVNVIPANTKYKTTSIHWQKWQNVPIPEDLHVYWKDNNVFELEGMAVMLGNILHNKKKKDLSLFCIDLDNKKAVESFSKDWDKVKSNTLCEWHDDNPNKIHVYGYSHKIIPNKSSDRHDSELSDKIDKNEVPAFEVKGDASHGIMFCTPSMHAKGKPYHTGECIEPKIMDGIEDRINDICKEHGLVYLDANGQHGHGLDTTDSKWYEKSVSRGERGYLVPMEELYDDKIQVNEGHNRSLALLRWADSVAAQTKGLTQNVLVQLVMAKNQTMCSPPYPESKAASIAKQAFAFVEKDIGIGSASKGKKGLKLPHEHYAKAILDSTGFIFLTLVSGDILYYQDGVYRTGGENIIAKQCQSRIEGCTNNDVKEVIGTIQRSTGYHEVSEFDKDPYLVNLKNGWINLNDGKLTEHSTKILSRVQIPIIWTSKNFIPTNATKLPRPKKFDKFLASSHVEDKITIQRVWEMMALCIIKTNKFEKAFMNIGSGSDGKSTLFRVIESVLGGENVSHVSIHEFAMSQFAPSYIDGKLANIYADIEDNELTHVGVLKQLISGDSLYAQPKFKMPYSFVPFATLIFSANKLPDIGGSAGEGTAIFRRFEIINWVKSFMSKKDGRDVDLAYKIILDEKERNAIFVNMVYYAKKLLKSGELTYETTAEDVRREWKEKADPIQGYINSGWIEISNDYESTVAATTVYTNFLKWCKINKFKAVSNKRFSHRFTEMSGVEHTRSRVKDGSEIVNVWVYRGCKIIDPNRKNVLSDKKSSVSEESQQSTL